MSNTFKVDIKHKNILIFASLLFLFYVTGTVLGKYTIGKMASGEFPYLLHHIINDGQAHSTSEYINVLNAFLFRLTLFSGFLGLPCFLFRNIAFFERFCLNLHRKLTGIPRPVFLLVLSALGLTLSTLGARYVLMGVPHIEDSSAQYFHAKVFSTGKLYETPPQDVDFFLSNAGMWANQNGKWYSRYTPSHTFLLMLGILSGAPWMVGPLIGVLILVSLYFLAEELYDEETARWTALICILSPFWWGLSSSFMQNSTAMLTLTLFFLFFLRLLRLNNRSSGIISGLFLGLAFMTRPWTAIAFSVPILIWGLIHFIRQGISFKSHIIDFALGFSVFFFLLLFFNYRLTGNPFLFNFHVYNRFDRIGFGASRGFYGDVIHNFPRAMKILKQNLYLLNTELLGWPISLLFVAALFVNGSRDGRDILLLITAVVLIAAYYCYWFNGIAYGSRYYYSSIGCLLMLTIRGIKRSFSAKEKTIPLLLVVLAIGHWIWYNNFNPKTPYSSLRLILVVFFASFLYAFYRRKDPLRQHLFVLVVLFIFTGYLHNFMFATPDLVKKYYQMGSYDNRIEKAIKKFRINNALIFIRCENHYYYGEAIFSRNSPGLDGDIVYAKDLGERNLVLMNRYPQKEYYLFDVEEENFFPLSRERLFVPYGNILENRDSKGG